MTIFGFFERGIVTAFFPSFAWHQFVGRCCAMSLPCKRLRWAVVDDSRSGGNQARARTRFRAVGRLRGGKQLLSTSADLVRTVVRNELIVQDAVPSSGSQRPDDHSEFFRTSLSSSLEPANSVANVGHFP